MEIELNLRHVRRCEGEDVRDDPHRSGRRVDVSVADHELLQNVVLNGPGQLGHRNALLLGGDDVERHHRQHRAVHRHRHAHRVERDAGEEGPHIVDRIDRDARHPDVAGHARMIRIVAAVSGEIEGDRQPLLTRGEIGAVKRVRFLGGRESRVLANRPRLIDVHRRIRAAKERREARPVMREVEPCAIALVIERLDVDAFRRRPHLHFPLAGKHPRGGEGNIREIGNQAHRIRPVQ